MKLSEKYNYEVYHTFCSSWDHYVQPPGSTQLEAIPLGTHTPDLIRVVLISKQSLEKKPEISLDVNERKNS